MLSLKNPFARSTPAHEPAAAVQQGESAASVQDAQEKAGRAQSAYQAKLDELATARSQVAELDRLIGEKIADDIDANVEILERERVHTRIQHLESAISVLLDRKTAAEVAVEQALRQQTEDAVNAALAALSELGERGQVLLLELEMFSDDLAVASDTLLEVGGNAAWSYQTKELRSYLDVFVTIAKQLPATRNADSGAYRKYRSWLEAVASICGKPQA